MAKGHKQESHKRQEARRQFISQAGYREYFQMRATLKAEGYKFKADL